MRSSRRRIGIRVIRTSERMRVVDRGLDVEPSHKVIQGLEIRRSVCRGQVVMVPTRSVTDQAKRQIGEQAALGEINN